MTMSTRLANFFATEQHNATKGGVNPPTIGSAWDSLQQAPDDVLDVWVGKGREGRATLIEFAGFTIKYGADTELVDVW